MNQRMSGRTRTGPKIGALAAACLMAMASTPASAQHLAQYERLGHHVSVFAGYAAAGGLSDLPSSRMDSPEVAVGFIHRWRKLAIGGYLTYLHAGTFFNSQTSRREFSGSLLSLTGHVRWSFMTKHWGALFIALDTGLSILQLPSSAFTRLGGPEGSSSTERVGLGVAMTGGLGAVIPMSDRLDGLIQVRIPLSWNVLESDVAAKRLASVGIVLSFGLEFGLEP